MGILTAPQMRVQGASETRNLVVKFTPVLEEDELLSGTPTITETGTSDLTISNKAISTSALTISGSTAIAATAVQCTVTGGTAGKLYDIKIVIGTNGSPAQTFARHILVKFEED